MALVFTELCLYIFAVMESFSLVEVGEQGEIFRPEVLLLTALMKIITEEKTVMVEALTSQFSMKVKNCSGAYDI